MVVLRIGGAEGGIDRVTNKKVHVALTRADACVPRPSARQIATAPDVHRVVAGVAAESRRESARKQLVHHEAVRVRLLERFGLKRPVGIETSLRMQVLRTIAGPVARQVADQSVPAAGIHTLTIIRVAVVEAAVGLLLA